MRTYNKDAWRLVLIEGTRLLRNQESISWTNICKKHHVAPKYAGCIPIVLAHMQMSNLENKNLETFYQKLQEEYKKRKDIGLINPNSIENFIPNTTISPLNLTSIPLEDLITELNKRGFKIYQ